MIHIGKNTKSTTVFFLISAPGAFEIEIRRCHFTFSLGTKTNFFSQTGLVNSVLTYIAFSIWIYEETKNIFWASEIVATLTHVERFYDLMNLKLFCFSW